jgi:hypothetical protein
MSRWIWSRISNQLLTPEEFYAETAARKRADGFPTPNIISDCMDPTQNMVDGRHYTSKSEYQRAVRAAGCEIVGNDPAFKKPKAPEYQPKGVAEDIKRAIEESS